MIAVVDYGVGNLFSLGACLRRLNAPFCVTGDRDAILSADRVLLPGVGAFGDAMESLCTSGLDIAVKEAAALGKPVMGVCLGMQLLFDTSLEFGERAGLGLIPGVIAPLRGAIPESFKVPQIGWNNLTIEKRDPFLSGFPDGAHVYYVHSFYATQCEKYVLAASDYGVSVPGVVRRGNVLGCQFHPEKSGRAGLILMRNFAEGAL